MAISAKNPTDVMANTEQTFQVLTVSSSFVVCTLKCICVVRAITCVDDRDRKKESGER